MAATLLVVVVTSIAILISWLYQSYKRNKIFGKIPGPAGLPILGNAHQLEVDGTKFYNQIMSYSEEFGRKGIFMIWLGTKPMVCLARAIDVEKLLNSSKHMDKSAEYRFLHPWLGTGLLTSTGAKWRSRRKMLTPTFHFKILNDFLAVFNEQSDVMLSKLKEKAGPNSFNIFNDITLCALDIICETAMGRDVNAQSNSDSPYVNSVYKMSELALNRMKQPWHWPDILYNLIGPGKEHDKCLQILHGFTEKVIAEKKQELLNGGPAVHDNSMDSAEEDHYVGTKKKRMAFLDMLLHMSEPSLTSEEIREEVDTFMFEGHDTTAAGINWATYLIGADQSIQERLQDELDSIFGDSERHPTMEDLKDMKYLECCIKESLRLYPSVPLFGRTLTEDAVIDGFTIPKGTTGNLVVSALHRDPEYFPDPDVYDPDRFSHDNATTRHPYAYIPFSAGLRNCIGQRFALLEEKVLLSTIFRNFKVESLQKRDELRPTGELILRPEKGIIVRLTSRK
ncbi:cytochrome P450 4V2 [Patella vulgata]|uniref:cytochrome P450 4V2 n=1 Tax=Patella vulgata TaxID=6465 RepID=UPI00218099C7|nr:cytochrome P450 4V2 [Patella vulgata]